MVKVTFERRDGRVTESEYRAVVTVGGRSAYGPWCFTKADARRTNVEPLRRSLFDADASAAILAGNAERRMAGIRRRLEVDRRPNAWGLTSQP